MLKKSNKRKSFSNKKYEEKNTSKLSDTAFSILMFAIAIFTSFLILVPGENIWFYMHKFVVGLFGVGSIFLPISFFYICVVSLKREIKNKKSKLILFLILMLSVCSSIYVFSENLVNFQPKNFFMYVINCYKDSKLDRGSGLLGGILGALLVWSFGIFEARVTSLIFLFVSLMFVTGTTLPKLWRIFLKPFGIIREKMKDIKIKNDIKNIGPNDSFDKENTQMVSEKPLDKNFSETKSEDSISKVTEQFLSRIKQNRNDMLNEKSEEKDIDETLCSSSVKRPGEDNYEFPSVELLNKPPVPKDEDISSELNTNGRTLVETLNSFNVQTKIVDISRGPAVTRYELQPASGVKISKITTLADDIALNLAAAGVRIEAPIPGKAAVGVEIPNKVISIVGMRELISSNVFKSSKSKLTVVLGRDISGNVTIADLAKMPHLLIAGSTGSGKSVCINSFIISILYNAKPSEVRLLMIDPKVVELGIYNGIPHLLVPVVTDARKAAGALGWAVNEMIKRYKLFADNNVRDLSSYNEMIEQKSKESEENIEKMPQIVIIIDELSDLMMAAPNEVEDYICRLAQMARAAGMYLVIATQRPSVDVITGIIKANIPSRIALAVSSQIDSRTILDMSGAEKLLGRGDMLFSPAGSSKPIRVQGCYVTDKEIERVIKYVKNSQNSDYDTNVVNEIEKNAVRDNSKSQTEGRTNEMDPVMKEAIECVMAAGQASTSLLQRKLRVGYARAGRLVDEMEQMGIVGPHEGSKPRQVLINYQQFLEMNLNQSD